MCFVVKDIVNGRKVWVFWGDCDRTDGFAVLEGISPFYAAGAEIADMDGCQGITETEGTVPNRRYAVWDADFLQGFAAPKGIFPNRL